MIVPRVFKSRQRKRKNISIVLSSQETTVILVELRWFFVVDCCQVALYYNDPANRNLITVIMKTEDLQAPGWIRAIC